MQISFFLFTISLATGGLIFQLPYRPEMLQAQNENRILAKRWLEFANENVQSTASQVGH